ncbi:MAG: TetR/AcrR family transcriptional regulator [Rhodospirillales bacterium]|nr:TetR/AcrR family transcriptional regulator [Rhodospirillales bacterium]
MGVKAEQTKQRIIEAASLLFWRKSYRGVNMNQISLAAEVNKATVYAYYPTKEDLALAVIENNFERTRDWVYDGAFEAYSDPCERLETIYRRIYESAAWVQGEDGVSPGCPFVNIATELGTESLRIREAVDGAFIRFGDYYKTLARDVQKQGTARGTITQSAKVEALLRYLHGTLVASKIKNRPEELLDAIPTAKEILLS